ncbi:beta-aspartyl-peptidase [Thalassotalea sp. LPB0316]|uniref:beta-aspartyl-peptidase n=1 Tax=Thalassotalea sp. LPB0316 TaxID=2769490 RepID=UPI001868332E|nr:beta-aspartyl-peptidase [Thalassotalea sp. LPB0316]QOL25729.1 beta-aspartyl-peptidase [Thalassotalea sp. LPB0316]
MKLLKQGRVYAPQDLGRKDVLIAGGKIIAIEDEITMPNSGFVEVIDARGKLVVPGFVDSLVHITGGGGEGGFTTRTPEMHINDAVVGGVTTLVGVLGTDAITRSLENLLAKAKELKALGLSVYCYTGSYHLPAVTITESITKDIMLIDEFIGVGEVAIADHRATPVDHLTLAQVASQARTGGMLASKSGIVSIHVGDDKQGLNLLREVAEYSAIPVGQFYPTHINRTKALLADGIEFAKQGGYIDFTTSTTAQILAQGEVAAAQALAIALQEGVDIGQLTMSSDGNASLPVFDDKAKLIDLQLGEVKTLHQSFVEAINCYQVDIELALRSVTSSPADILALKQKGRLILGNDADINLLDEQSLAIDSVIANGAFLMRANTLITNAYF